MFGKNKNLTKEISALNKQKVELKDKLFSAIALELGRIEFPYDSKRSLSKTLWQYKEAFEQKHSEWTLEQLNDILTSLRAQSQNFSSISQVGIKYSSRFISRLNAPQVHEIANLSSSKAFRHDFSDKSFSLKEVTFMVLNNNVPVKPTFLKLMVLTYTNQIVAVAPASSPCHNPSSGVFTMLDTATFPIIKPPVLGQTTNIAHFTELQKTKGSQIVVDAKNQTITVLGPSKIQNLMVGFENTTAFSILRPTKIFTRQYIDLATGKYAETPSIILTEPNAPSLTGAQKMEVLKQLSGARHIDPEILARTFKNQEKFDGQPVPETHFVAQNALGETFLTGSANLLGKDLPIVKAPDGKLLVQIDYPQSIISEEVYGTQGQKFNQRFYDYSGHRLKTLGQIQTPAETKKPEQKDMFDGIEQLEF